MFRRVSDFFPNFSTPLGIVTVFQFTNIILYCTKSTAVFLRKSFSFYNSFTLFLPRLKLRQLPLQYYSAIFEATVENLTGGLHKTDNLTFEVSGEGNLPRVTILSPSVRNKKGQPLLLYKKNLVGRTEILPLELTNDGTLASKVILIMITTSIMLKFPGSL